MSGRILGQTTKSVDGKIWIGSQDYLELIAANKVPGHFALHKFGANSNVTTGEDVVWTNLNGYTYLTSAEQLKIYSDDAADTAAGTGARSVIVEGVDINFNEISEEKTLNGVTPVTTLNSYYRVNRAYVKQAGTGEVNAGLILIRNNADSNTLARIEIGRGQTQMAIWTVPAGHTLLVQKIYATEKAAKRVDVKIYAIDRAIANQSWRFRDALVVNSDSAERGYKPPLRYTEKTDFQLRATSSPTAGSVDAGFMGYYET
jgi:hypothetical protein